MAREKNSIANGRRLNTSTFFLTINTNQRVRFVDKLTAKEQAFYDKFKKAVEEYFVVENAPKWLLFRKAGDTLQNSVKNIDIRLVVELESSEKRMVHAHALVEIKHFTTLHFNLEDLRQYTVDVCGQKAYVNAKIPKTPEDWARVNGYMNKENKNKDVEFIDDANN